MIHPRSLFLDALGLPPNARWPYTGGTPRLALDGTPPADVTGQAEHAWTHVLAMLERDGMTVHDLVRPSFLLEVEAIAAKARLPRP